jgi:lipopolysaccharide biosynthesis glycosyltransferase
MLNSKKCKGIFKTVQETMKKEGFEKCIFLDQDALNLSFEEFYDLTPHGFINANMPQNEKLPENILALHYNVTEKPFAETSVKHWFDAIAITTYSGYLNIAELCKCSLEFLEKIKNHIEYVKNYQSLCKYNFYFQRVKLHFAREITKRMKEFKL